MKNYNIITLGTSGAGKTVFLASLFKSLSIQGDHGFFLEIEDPKKQNSLNKIYTEVISGETWPRGTRGEVTEWVFTCCVKTQDLSKYPACKFTYFDYAGALLTDLDTLEEESLSFDFQKKVEEADAVLAILDGLRVLKFMEDQHLSDKGVMKWMQSDLPNVMQLIDDCKRDTPVHFIISKWDLVENKYSLLEVRNRLSEKVTEFKNVVRNRTGAGCPVRLIPISSVGMSFATLQSNGQMKKIPGAIPHPFQVEVPLACVLIDGLKAQVNKLKVEQEKILQRPTEVKPKYGFIGKIDQLISSTVLSVSTTVIRQFLLANLPDKYKINNSALQKFIDLTEKSVEKIEGKIQRTQEEVAKKEQEAAQETEKLRQQQEKSLKDVNDEETALNHAVDSFFYIQKKLIANFPASDLGGSGL
ncbi:hypothetical protein VB711_15620 [Cronbergia sp. UHCC 0137]|uniref:TRAFAC clade GTPase domain-containing protein n=1 Tax=Cronbergia sp. UHCC 0137 TaxID=3110239 RepID=UPI002B1F4CEE|nr:hypothetical protein [Cronbergia sp. UHCC 0137]MEA5619256.1 hypothetical protein [Cronbergia sp. UHCC 0137]